MRKGSGIAKSDYLRTAIAKEGSIEHQKRQASEEEGGKWKILLSERGHRVRKLLKSRPRGYFRYLEGKGQRGMQEKNNTSRTGRKKEKKPPWLLKIKKSVRIGRKKKKKLNGKGERGDQGWGGGVGFCLGGGVVGGGGKSKKNKLNYFGM